MKTKVYYFKVERCLILHHVYCHMELVMNAKHRDLEEYVWLFNIVCFGAFLRFNTCSLHETTARLCSSGDKMSYK